MAENFTDKQKEIVARKLGYDGPMQGFDDFLNSSPALGMKYASITDKFATRMAKGGVIRKKRGYADGGVVTFTPGLADKTPQEKAAEYSNLVAKGFTDAQIRAAADTTFGTQSQSDWSYLTNLAKTSAAVTPTAQQTAAANLGTTTVTSTTPAVSGLTTAQQTAADNLGAVTTNTTAVTPTAPVTPVTPTAPVAPTPTAPVAPTPTAPVAATKVDDQAVSNWFQQNPNASDFDIAKAMTQYGVTADQIARATGVPAAQVQQRFEVASSPKTQAIMTAFQSGDVAATQAAFNNSGLSADQLAATFNLKKENLDYLRSTGIQIKPTTEEVGMWLRANPTATDYDVKLAMDQNGVTPDQVAKATGLSVAEIQQRYNDAKAPVVPPVKVVPPVTTPGNLLTAPISLTTTGGAPGAPSLTSYTALQTALPTPAVAGQAAPTTTAASTTVAAPTPLGVPTAITAPTAATATAAPGVTTTLTGVTAQEGAVSETAKAQAATQAPATTAVAGMEAAQGVAGTVQGAPTRVAETGEMVSGAAVDMARVEQALAQTQAAQGVVSEEMTVQGQLNKLTRDFDAGNPPPWAAASMRAATAQMAARGLGASSMAGQAIIQATLEAATPIAAADAKVFETMGLQNLSNRQQTAMLIGQQRAAFLGQEFDQAFQTKVLNAAKVADIANRNFDAQTTIALENSRLANSMDVANLSARNAVVLGKMAQMSQLETQNLSNRQQVAVENARAALTMDIKNLDNRQQTTLFKAQELNDALVSDAGFANATNITNAQNALDAAKVSASLMQSAQQFNADLTYKVNSTNALAANELSKFNAQQANAREEFNANMTTQINLANAKILAEISTANTAAVNAANAVNAKNATDLSAAVYAQQSQTYRDLLEMSWKTGESEKDRATQIAAATLTSSASTNAAKTTADASNIAAIAKAGVTLAVNYDKVKTAVTDIFGEP